MIECYRVEFLFDISSPHAWGEEKGEGENELKNA
jgi:hypothetical protein